MEKENVPKLNFVADKTEIAWQDTLTMLRLITKKDCLPKPIKGKGVIRVNTPIWGAFTYTTPSMFVACGVGQLCATQIDISRSLSDLFKGVVLKLPEESYLPLLIKELIPNQRFHSNTFIFKNLTSYYTSQSEEKLIIDYPKLMKTFYSNQPMSFIRKDIDHFIIFEEARGIYTSDIKTLNSKLI